MAKKPEAKKPNLVSKALSKRINVGKGKTLGRDVTTPKWLKTVGGYFKGSWEELRQVRWPSRRATWGLTIAVIVFTALLSAFILGLDYGFEQLFKKVIL